MLQLNAATDVEGTFEYSPASGTELSAGNHTLSATFTPTDSARYSIATSTVMITVNKAIPTIIWDPPAAITYGTTLGATQLNANAGDAPGTLIYSPVPGTALNAGTGQKLLVSLPESGNYRGQCRSPHRRRSCGADSRRR